MEGFLDASLIGALGILVFCAFGGWLVILGWAFMRQYDKIKHYRRRRKNIRKKRRSLRK